MRGSPRVEFTIGLVARIDVGKGDNFRVHGTNPGNRLRYKRVNGPYTLGMSAGINNKLPFGNFPRPPDFIHPHDDGPAAARPTAR